MDSIKSLSFCNDKFSRLHSKAPKSGHIHKGHSSVAHNATIPSKYETYVIESSEHKGFNSTNKRFNYEFNENIMPGIGYYNGMSKSTSESPSFSTRGTGSFASRNRYTAFNPATEIPAPNNYNVKLPDSKLDFNRASYTKNFHPDIAMKAENSNTDQPAPNLYNIQSKLMERNYASSFKSKTNRDINSSTNSSEKPGPGQYSVDKADNITAHNQTIIQSVFKSNSKRDDFKPPEGPGPSDYFVIRDLTNKYMNHRFVRKHYLCLAASALKLPPTPPLPGPSDYNIRSSMGEPNHFMSSSMFTSTSSRWTKPGMKIGLGMFEGQTVSEGGNFPGPAHYQPSKPLKQSFHYNANKKWL